MTLDQQIRELTARPESRFPFLTLYVETNGGDGSRKDRVRLLLRHELEHVREAIGSDRDEHRELIEKGVRQIESFMSDSLEPDARGVAVFSSPSEEFFRPLSLTVPVESQLHIGSRPHVRQLVELRERHPHLVVVLVDAKNARLLELDLGTVVQEIGLEDPDVPKKTDQGGWSQANIQRHIQDHIDHHHKDVAERLTRLFDRAPVAGVIVSGQERNAANFLAQLPKRVQERVFGTLRLDIRASAEEIISACEALVEQQRRDRTGERLEELEAAAQKNGRGALGLNRVIEAVNERKLERLFVAQRANGRGWKCTGCSLLGHEIPLGCPACGEPVLTVDLVEQFIAAAESASAAIDLVPDSTILDRYQGVGAFLRF